MAKRVDSSKVAQAQMDFEMTLYPGAVKSGMAEAGATKRDMWQLDPNVLELIPNFNVRTKDDEYYAHIRNIANSILAEGFYQHRPLAGYVARVGDRQVVYIYDGHCRLEGALLAIKEGAAIERVPVVVSQAGLSELDLTIALVKANNGKPLLPYELGLVFKRMVKFGLTEEEVATRLGFSEQYVKNLLLLMSAPEEFRKMVREGVVAASNAVEMLVKYGDKALDKLLDAQRRANEAGKDRVTGKHLSPDIAFKKAVKKHAENLYSVVESVKNDDSYSKLSPELRGKLEEILSSLAEGQTTE